MTEASESTKPAFERGTGWLIVGFILMIVGVVIIIIAYGQDVSVTVSPRIDAYSTSGRFDPADLMPREVVNTGLLQKQMMTMISGALAAVIGAIITATGALLGAIRP